MKISGPADDATAATMASTLSTITGMHVGGDGTVATLKSKLCAAEAKARSVAGGSKDSNLPQENQAYHMPLFLEYKKRKKGGKAIRCRQDVRDLIAKGELPELLISKVDEKPMCLAWHVKGMCNPEACPHAPDHVEYSVEEYQPLGGWCAQNYPKEE